MNIELTEHIPADFDDQSKVWIYQSSRLFLMSEAFDIEDILNNFVAQWKSHGDKVKGYANLFFGQFIVLMADETHAAVGGCSTDSSVHVIKAIEEKFKVNMFDRQNLAFMVQDKVQLLPLSQLNYAAENNFITPDTLYFDNTVLTKKDLLERWIVPVKDSWLGKRISFNKTVNG
jgi:hypothetical protein